MSLDRLIEKIEKTQNPSVAGLDPKLAYVPEYIKEKCFEKYGETLKGAAKALLEFNKGLIDALYDIVPAVKPQAAYYEMYGPAGVKALYKTQEYARSKGMYVITDGKRNDIGTTMEAYAAASGQSTGRQPDLRAVPRRRADCKRLPRQRRHKAASRYLPRQRQGYFRARKDLQPQLRRASGQEDRRHDHL